MTRRSRPRGGTLLRSGLTWQPRSEIPGFDFDPATEAELLAALRATERASDSSCSCGCCNRLR